MGNGTGDQPSTASGASLQLNEVFDEARLWGMELDSEFRVLAVTLEPHSTRYPWGQVNDRRVQVLAFPVSTVFASLRRESRDQREILTFREEQLPDIVAALDGPTLKLPPFDGVPPRQGEWGPQLSLEGRSSAADGHSRSIRIDVESTDSVLQLFARFDELRLRHPDGTELSLA